jgi:hypothetical protein
MITPTARSMTLPLEINSLNSLPIPMAKPSPCLIGRGRVCYAEVGVNCRA